MTTSETQQTIKAGDHVRYQTEGMPEERKGVVNRVTDHSYELSNGDTVPRNAFIQLLPLDEYGIDTEAARIDMPDIKKPENGVVNIQGLTWKRKKVQKSNGVIWHMDSNFTAGKELRKGQNVYVTGNKDRICIYDPITGDFLIRESPSSRRARGENVRCGGNKKQDNKTSQVRDEDAGTYKTSADKQNEMQRIDAAEALGLAKSLKAYVDGLIAKIESGQTAVQELMNLAHALNINSNENKGNGNNGQQ